MAWHGFDSGWPRFHPGAIVAGAGTLLLLSVMPAPAPAPPDLPGPSTGTQVSSGFWVPEQSRTRPARSPAPAAEPPRRARPEIERLGRLAPRYPEPVRERYAAASDLHELMVDILPAAASGERAIQYHLYLVLSRCQAFLNMDAAEARALNERVLLALNEHTGDERQRWEAEYWRCQSFADADLDPLRAAMGADTPGAEVEYASIWFERALRAGYPPALAEAALRINLLSVADRKAMLEEAVLAGDADVYWQLYVSSPGGGGVDPASVEGLAWLILACRRGYDCRAEADWFRNDACREPGAACTPGESAIEHHWYSISEPQRLAAWHLANDMQRRIAAGEAQGLPWPALAKRNIYDSRFDRRD